MQDDCWTVGSAAESTFSGTRQRRCCLWRFAATANMGTTAFVCCGFLGTWTHAFCTQPCRPALIVSLVCCQQKKSVLKDLADFAAVFKFACGKRAAEIAGQLLLFLKDFTGCHSSAFCLTAKHAGSEVCCVSFSISYVLNNLPLERTTLPSSHKNAAGKYIFSTAVPATFSGFAAGNLARAAIPLRLSNATPNPLPPSKTSFPRILPQGKISAGRNERR